MRFSRSILFALASFTAAHPGEHHDHDEVLAELAARSVHAARIQSGLAGCARDPSFKALRKRGEVRRSDKASKLRSVRSLPDTGKRIPPSFQLVC